jgi:hypothetical protein
MQHMILHLAAQCLKWGWIGPVGSIRPRGKHKSFVKSQAINARSKHPYCRDPGLPPGIPVMHTIHDPRKTIVNTHNRVGISDYNIQYIWVLKSYIGRLAEYKCHAVQLTHLLNK